MWPKNPNSQHFDEPTLETRPEAAPVSCLAVLLSLPAVAGPQGGAEPKPVQQDKDEIFLPGPN